ncbi:IS66 family insertion sequence element accessory protein TnpB [Paracoccus beibuensis]|uniref:IS66 family insertion sequence element accessory protein TnpB n=1 Tax=Paracoccus beibuensis TaxID=547602 RepID=UPI00223FDD7E|nr:IS66 family insertion sequence element accessory protein TnpB [Paracoccus beibuensis]
MDADDPMPPSYYNHNLYIQWDFSEVDLIEVFTSFAASQGMQNRAGGHVARNVCVSNGLAFNNMAGWREGEERPGLFGNFLLNVVTQAGYPLSKSFQGAISRGVDSAGYNDSWLGNLFVNHIDPNNPAELERYGEGADHALKVNQEHPPVYNDSKIIWGKERVNVTPEDLEIARRTTIQIFAEKTMGRKVTVREFCDWLSTRPAKQRVKIVTQCWGFFQEAFGNVGPERTANTSLTFAPDVRSDGFRWDNEANWSTGDLPMDGDSVHAAGLYTTFQMRIMVATKPIDLRKGHDGLAALVSSVLRKDPFTGSVFVFRSRRADRLKLLYWDGTGLVTACKRLEDARFAWPAIKDGVMALNHAQFKALLAGLD